MLRLIGFLVLIAILAAGLGWLADRPGEIVMQWQGYQFETSVFRAIVILIGVIVLVLVGWTLLRHAWHSPAVLGTHLAKRRQKQGIDALSSGIIALGAGDKSAAVRAAIQARKSLPNEPLTHLLRAQAAQLSGDRTTARRIFEAMLAAPDTEQLGLRGLFLEAQREGEIEAARHFAERAVKLNPKLQWAIDALFELQCRQSDWAGALETLASARKNGHVERAVADRRRAVLLTGQAQEAEESDPERALALALEAHGLAPDLVPAAAIAGRLLASRGNTPRAAKILQRTWSRSPQPDLATAYAFARIGDSPRDRLDRVKQFAALSPMSIEGPIAVATAAIEARQYDEARTALEPLLQERLTQRVATLMARIESESGDKGRVREWLARAVNAPRDPAWTADGFVAETWAPISPVTGQLDAFRWRVPVEPVNKGDGDYLSGNIDELVALGSGQTIDDVEPPEGPSGPPPATKKAEAQTIEAVPVTQASATEAPPAQERKPAARVATPEPAVQASAKTAAVPPATKTAAANVKTEAAEAAPATARKGQRKGETRIFVAPPAPDDPGPDANDPDDVGMPFRPQRA